MTEEKTFVEFQFQSGFVEFMLQLVNTLVIQTV